MMLSRLQTPTPRANTPQLVWSALGNETEALIKFARIAPPGTRVVVDANRLNWMRRFARHLALFVKNGDEIEEITRRGARLPGRKIQSHCLPSQISRDGPPIAVTLDIIMSPEAASAWQELDRLVAEGLSSQVAATALVGTPVDIAERIFDYAAFGAKMIILTAPVERAPFYAVHAHLEPLLASSHLQRGRTPFSPFGDSVIAWNDAAL